MRKYQTEAERKAARLQQNREAKARMKAKQAAATANLSSSSLPPIAQNLNVTDQNATVLHAVTADETLAAPKQVSRNEKKYQKLLDDYLGPATGVLILILCLAVYRFDMESSERIADYLAMNQAEQDLIIPPLAAWMDKQHWDERTKDMILQSGDIVGLVLGFGMYASRVVGTLNELKGHVHGTRGNAAQQAAPVGQQPGANGHSQPAGTADAGIVWGSPVAGLSQYAA